MARNKHPEETVKLILDVSAKLFAEKGYDKTSLQDIISETKLSKGAIYHHFISKDDIFVQVCNRIGQENADILAKVRDNKTLNGQQKLKQIFRTALHHPNQKQMLNIVPYLLDAPKFLVMQIRDLYDEVVPYYIKPILEEGIADGSIRTDHPEALAEMIMLLTNIWINPLLQPTSPEKTKARCEVFIQLMGGIGVEAFDDDLIDAYVNFSRMLQSRNS